MKVIAYKDVIWKILNHLGLLEEEPSNIQGRSPPDGTALVRSAEIVCEPFCDDLEPGEAGEMLQVVMSGGRN